MFALPKLNYAYDALEPYIDKETMEIHYTKHHQAYITGLNAVLENHPELANKTVEELLSSINTLPESIRTAIKNHGGGHANHSLFWTLLKKDNGSQITGKLKELIERDFGSIESFKEQFETAAKTRFGSGWAWLVIDQNKKLSVISTANQDSPMMDGYQPILALDVWEHSYYLKYQNRRPEYISAFWHIVDWNVVEQKLLEIL